MFKHSTINRWTGNRWSWTGKKKKKRTSWAKNSTCKTTTISILVPKWLKSIVKRKGDITVVDMPLSQLNYNSIKFLWQWQYFNIFFALLSVKWRFKRTNKSQILVLLHFIKCPNFSANRVEQNKWPIKVLLYMIVITTMHLLIQLISIMIKLIFRRPLPSWIVHTSRETSSTVSWFC